MSFLTLAAAGSSAAAVSTSTVTASISAAAVDVASVSGWQILRLPLLEAILVLSLIHISEPTRRPG